MIKWLLVIGVVGFVYMFFIKKKPLESSSSDKDKIKDVNDMVECAVCKTYCEIDDMILSGSKYYCSQECLEKA
jgi:uncharacterized protein